jgi:hypothetical protein
LPSLLGYDERMPKDHRPPTPDLTTAFEAAIERVLNRMIDEGKLGGNQSIPRVAYSYDEAGYALGLSGATIRKLVRAGMPSIAAGPSSRRIVLSEAIAWMREHGDQLASD